MEMQNEMVDAADWCPYNMHFRGALLCPNSSLVS